MENPFSNFTSNYGKSGEEVEAFTSEFNKRAYMHGDYPNQMLVIYDGDKKVVNKNYSHGNSTHKKN